MNQLTLSKLEVFALRADEWLFNITVLNESKLHDQASEYMSHHNEVEDKKPFWKSKNRITYDDALRIVEWSDEFKKVEKEAKDKLKRDILSKFELVSVREFGSFANYEFVIKDKNTGKLYKGFCNKKGGENYPINCLELTE